jgi:hypothetical protein
MNHYVPAGNILNTALARDPVKEVRLFKQEIQTTVINNPYLTSGSTIQGKPQVQVPVNTIFGIGSLNTPLQASYVKSGMLENRMGKYPIRTLKVNKK